MADGVPTNKPSRTVYSWAALVKEAWGDSWHQKEDVYIWSNGRRFKDSGANHGIYTGTGT